MKARLGMAILAVAVAMPAAAQTDQRNETRSERAARERDRTYNGRDREYRRECRQSSGTTGAVAGGAGGALAANALGGGLLGTVAGGVGGALLGRHLDKKHDAAQNRRNGC